MDTDLLIKYFTALLTPTIAIIGVYIAYQQWITSERKRRQELFELRHKYLYSEIIRLIKTLPSIVKMITLKDNFDGYDEIIDYSRHRIEYGFLISKEDADKLAKLHAQVFIEMVKMIKDGKENLSRNLEEYNSKTLCLFENSVEDIFDKYLRIDDKSNLKKMFPTLYVCINKLFLFLIRKIF